VVLRNYQCAPGGPARIPERYGARRAFRFSEKTKSEEPNGSYNPTSSIATRKESVREMDNVNKVEPTEGGCGE
jgi:hypothetical protein